MRNGVLTAILLAGWAGLLSGQIPGGQVSVQVPPVIYYGDPIDITVQYPSLIPRILYFSSTYQADYLLDDFRWSNGMYFAQVLTNKMTPASWSFRHDQSRYRVGIGQHWIKGEVVGYGASGYVYFTVVPRPGDFNDDGSVDVQDYARMVKAWLSAAGEENWDAACDMVQDEAGQINAADLCCLIEHWKK